VKKHGMDGASNLQDRQTDRQCTICTSSHTVWMRVSFGTHGYDTEYNLPV